MYSLPSTSKMCEPSPRAMKGGLPPTLRKARTGELTPPGMISCALRKSSSDLEWFMAFECYGAGYPPALRGTRRLNPKLIPMS